MSHIVKIDHALSISENIHWTHRRHIALAVGDNHLITNRDGKLDVVIRRFELRQRLDSFTESNWKVMPDPLGIMFHYKLPSGFAEKVLFQAIRYKVSLDPAEMKSHCALILTAFQGLPRDVQVEIIDKM